MRTKWQINRPDETLKLIRVILDLHPLIHRFPCACVVFEIVCVATNRHTTHFYVSQISSSTLGPLVLSGRHNGNRYAVTGFDILPYLGANNLPTSILTLNVLAWLTQDFVQSEQYPTGTVLVSTAATMPDMPTLFRHTRLAATDQDKAFDTEGYETLRNDQGEFLLNHQGIYLSLIHI